MAKNSITKDFLKGMRWRDIVQLDPDIISRMNKDALRVAVGRLSKNANKRVSEFRALGIESPATKWVDRSGGNFSTKGKSFNQLRSEFTRAKEYLTSQTSTVKGYRALQGEIETKLLKEDIEITHKDYEKFWRAYEKLKEINPAVKAKSLKYKVLKHVAYMVQSDRRRSPRTIAQSISSRIEDIEKEAENGRNDNGVSKFFSDPV